MGWCSGTQVFDGIVGSLLEDNLDKKEIIKSLTIVLEGMDWDCQLDSNYADHPLVKEVFKELHPRWYEED